MSFQKINPRFAVLAIIMVAAAAMRIPDAAQATPMVNFTPIGAMGLFGGAYFSQRWKAVLFPLLALFVSDLIINVFVYNGQFGLMYRGWYWVYGAFVLIAFIGRWIIRKVTVQNVLLAALAATLTHWLITDFSVWLGGGVDLRTMQPLSRDWSGLVQCYVQAIPYMRNFLLGAIVYSGIMFGAFEWMQRRYHSLQTA